MYYGVMLCEPAQSQKSNSMLAKQPACQHTCCLAFMECPALELRFMSETSSDQQVSKFYFLLEYVMYQQKNAVLCILNHNPTLESCCCRKFLQVILSYHIFRDSMCLLEETRILDYLKRQESQIAIQKLFLVL